MTVQINCTNIWRRRYKQFVPRKEVDMDTNIKKERINHHLTQQELGRLVGVKKQAVCEWEKRGRIPRMQTLIKLSKLFDKSINYLMGDSNEHKKK